jgi:signal transduction histidine kinase
MGDDTALRAALADEGRLGALNRTRLLDTPPEEAFDRLTRLVCRLLGVPVALVSLIEADRQFFKSVVGLPEPWSLLRQTSLLHSFCQHVVANGAPLLVQDARGHPLVSDSFAIDDLGVLAYLGMPLATADGHTLGALCAIDTQPRDWTPGDAAALRDLAAVTMGEVTLRRVALELEDGLRAARADRGNTQARARRLEALRELGNGVAHDLLNVMQCVQSGARLAEARLGRDPDTARHVLALVRDAARRGGALTGRFIAFARRGELRAEPADAAALLGRVREGLAQTPGAGAPLRVRVEASPDLPPVLADREELEAVVASLAAAARDAMPEGGTLTLGGALEDVAPDDAARDPRLRPGRYVRLTVADTGTGLRSGGGTPARAEGHGPTAERADTSTDLGLTMARALAEQTGGAVDLEARAGAGTTVTLRLPTA